MIFSFKDYLLNKTNPYQSVKNYKIFFKNKCLGVNFFDDDFENLLLKDESEVANFEFNFIIDDLFSWNNYLISALDLNKFDFIDFDTSCILTLLTNFENRDFCPDFQSHFLHSNFLFFYMLNNFYFIFLFNQIIKKKSQSPYYIAKLFRYDLVKNLFYIYLSKTNKFVNVKFSQLAPLFFYELFYQKRVVEQVYTYKARLFDFPQSLLSKGFLKKKINSYLLYLKKLILKRFFNLYLFKLEKGLSKKILKLSNFNKRLLAFNIKPLFWLKDLKKNTFFKSKNFDYSLLELKVLYWKFKTIKKKRYKNVKARLKYFFLEKKSLKKLLSDRKLAKLRSLKKKYNLSSETYVDFDLYNLLDGFFLNQKYLKNLKAKEVFKLKLVLFLETRFYLYYEILQKLKRL